MGRVGYSTFTQRIAFTGRLGEAACISEITRRIPQLPLSFSLPGRGLKPQ